MFSEPTATPSSIAGLLIGMQLTDSALPTGAFSHSMGFESYMHTEHICDEASFSQWMEMFVQTQLTFTDALAIRLVWDCSEFQQLLKIDNLVTAQSLPQQVRHASITQAKRLISIAEENYPLPEIQKYSKALKTGTAHGHPALVWSLVARQSGISKTEAIAQHLYATIISLTQNAVRAIPLGQSAGQRIIRAAQSWVTTAVEVVDGLDERDLGAVFPGLEIAQMRHERQRARLFMS